MFNTDELISFLDWLERSRRTVLCREDDYFDGEYESKEFVPLHMTRSEVDACVAQFNDFMRDSEEDDN